MSYKIGIDISGGDKSPAEIIKGVLAAHKELDEKIVLLGVKDEIEKELAKHKCSKNEFEIVHAPEKIEMAEAPVTSIRRKKKSSIVIGTRLLRDKKIDAFVSCGNTGAVTCAATLILGLIDGVDRPGIGLAVPTAKGGLSLIIDVGANIDCKPINFLQYGIMASAYCELVLHIDNPKIGLLNIGEEASKGLGVIKNVHKILSASSLNFTGNAEAKDIFSGKCDAIVCDGFTGNIALKAAEAGAETVGKLLMKAMKKGLGGKLALLLAKKNLLEFKKSFDYAEHGGAPLLGVDGIIIIGHGRSNWLAVKNAIRVAVEELSRDLNSEIKRRIHEIGQDSRVREVLTT